MENGLCKATNVSFHGSNGCLICESEGTRSRKFFLLVAWLHARSNQELGFSCSASFLFWSSNQTRPMALVEDNAWLVSSCTSRAVLALWARASTNQNILAIDWF